MNHIATPLESLNSEKQKSNPLITVVTVVFNGEEYLEKTIRSVTEQTYLNKEYIVIDGGSSDGTLDIIRKYEQHIDRWVSEWDKGIYDAMNKGIDFANGEWIIFMNAGDSFYNEQVMKAIVPYLGDEYLIVYGDALIARRGRLYLQNQKDRHSDVRKSIIHQSMFIRTTHLKGELYDPRYPVMADYDHLLKISIRNPEKVSYASHTVCIYDGTGISSRPLYTYIGEYERIARKHFGRTAFIKFQAYILPRMLYSLRLLSF